MKVNDLIEKKGDPGESYYIRKIPNSDQVSVYYDVMRNHPWYGATLLELTHVKVHGGITFSDAVPFTRTTDDGRQCESLFWLIGFECPDDEEVIQRQIQSLTDQYFDKFLTRVPGGYVLPRYPEEELQKFGAYGKVIHDNLEKFVTRFTPDTCVGNYDFEGEEDTINIIIRYRINPVDIEQFERDIKDNK